MTMKICLINPPHLESLDPILDPPLGLMYLASVIRTNSKHQVSIIDLSFHTDIDKWKDVIPKADVYGITIMTHSYHHAIKIRDVCKEINPDSKIMVGGSHPTALPLETMKDFDITVVGDGESIIMDGINYIENNNDYPKIFYSIDTCIDEIPYPARDLVPIKDYTRLVNGNQATSIITSRGCSYRCAFCLPKGTLVLTEDLTYIPIEQIKIGDILIGIVKRDTLISYERSRVLDTFKRKDRIYKIKTTKGNVKSTSEHPWLSNDYRWRKTKDFVPGQFLRKVSTPLRLPIETDNYKIGYIAGAFEGDGHIGSQDVYHDYGIYQSNVARLVGDYDMMDTALRYSNDLNFGLHEQSFNSNSWALDSCITTQRKFYVENIKKIITDKIISENDEYKRGYLAGIYDAEGSWPRNSESNWANSPNALRIHNTNEKILNRIAEYLHHFGFNTSLDTGHSPAIRLMGGLEQILLFFSLVNPKVEDKKQQIFDYHLKSKEAGYSQILDIDIGNICDVYNLETTTGNFIADGFVTHNCINSTKKEKVRFRSIENVINELKEIIYKYDIHSFVFYDDTFTLRQDLYILLNEIKKLNIEFRCNGDTRRNTHETFKRLYDAGCREIDFGIESGSQYILNKIHKGTKVWQNQLAISNAKKAGLFVKAFIMVGNPGESWKTVNETIDFINYTRPDYWSVFNFVPLPGCDIFINPNKYGIRIKTLDWNEYFNLQGNNVGGLTCETEHMTIKDIKDARDYMIKKLYPQTGPLQKYYEKLLEK